MKLHCFLFFISTDRSQKTNQFQREAGTYLTQNGLTVTGQATARVLGVNTHPRTQSNHRQAITTNHHNKVSKQLQELMVSIIQQFSVMNKTPLKLKVKGNSDVLSILHIKI